MEKPFTQITFDFSPAEEVNEEKINKDTAEKIPVQENENIKSVSNLTVPDIDSKEVEQPVEKVNPLKTRGRRPLKENNADETLQIPPDDVLFQKRYYPIGEVAGMFRVNQSLLRYWETEFDILQPKKNGKGDRFFRA